MSENELRKQIIMNILVGDFREGHARRRWFILYDLLAVGLLVAGWWIHPLAALGAILWFTMYDLLAYEGVAEIETLVFAAPYRRLLCSYRVTQTMFQITLIALTAILDIRVAVAWLLMWWFGVEDILYYGIGRYPLADSWSWLAWTPFGIFHPSPLSRSSVIIQAVVGVVFAVGIYILIGIFV